MLEPVLFFDFDNTITRGDVLDELIEKFSPNDEWQTWESAWANGRLSARDCLRLQVENLRVTRDVLMSHVATVSIDPWFVGILNWARQRSIEVLIVSDSFLPLIAEVLANNKITGVPVFANALEFSGNRLLPSFPFHDESCARSANAKRRHLVPYDNHTIIFAGDGRSDLDAALAADIVFAKDVLADELRARAIAFHPFGTLQSVYAFLESLDASPELPHRQSRSLNWPRDQHRVGTTESK